MFSHDNETMIQRCKAVVIWIDWYAYHVARFAGLQSAFGHRSEIIGIELVGGMGVHKGLKFREDLPPEMPIETLLANANWTKVSKVKLAHILWKRLNELNPELVLIPGYYTLPAITAALWARSNGRVSVLMTESTMQDHVRSAWKERLKSQLVKKLFDWAVTGGTAHVRYLRKLNFPENRIVSFYDVVGNDKLREAVALMRERSHPAKHSVPSKYFLYVGRLAPEKNLKTLMQAWLQYRKKGGTLKLVLVGDGPDSAALKRAAAESDYADDIVFAGHKSSRELWPYFAFASCFVLPSSREPWGLVVNEAMAASLPVIVSNACGCSENLVEHGRNGFVFDPSSESDLATCLTSFERLPAEERFNFGRLAAQRIAVYTPENFGKQIERIARETAAVRASSTSADSPRNGSRVQKLRRRSYEV